MADWIQITLLTLMAGMAMPVGASVASIERIHPRWLETEFRHSVIAFGGGALLAAVALVLVPHSIHKLNWVLITVCLASGAIAFMVLDIQLAARRTNASQLVAMLSDFVPEALALGATFMVSRQTGVLLAVIVTLQNLPEGFNSYRELLSSTPYKGKQIVAAFALVSLLGPAAGLTGYFFLADYPKLVSGIMLFASGGILYLIFQDITPQFRLKNHRAPTLGAVAGFLLGVLGKAAAGP